MLSCIAQFAELFGEGRHFVVDVRESVHVFQADGRKDGQGPFPGLNRACGPGGEQQEEAELQADGYVAGIPG